MIIDIWPYGCKILLYIRNNAVSNMNDIIILILYLRYDCENFL